MCVCDTGKKKSSPPLAFLLCKFQYLQLLQEIHFNSGSENRRESVGWKMPSFGSDISTFSLDQFLLFAFTVDSFQSSIEFMFFDDSIWLVMLKMSIKCMNTHCVCIRILQPPSTLLTIYRRSHFQESRRDQMNIKIMKLIIKKIDDITAEKHSIKRATRPISQIIGIYWKLMSTPTKKNHHQPSQK